jgi:hypothetical protein
VDIYTQMQYVGFAINGYSSSPFVRMSAHPQLEQAPTLSVKLHDTCV